METEQEIKRRRMLELMAGSIKPPQVAAVAEDAALTPVKPVVNLPPASTTPSAPEPVLAGGQLPPQQTKPIRIGYSTAGLTGVDKLLERKKAMEEAGPSSSVVNRGDFEEIEPPKQRKGIGGFLKNLGEGALSSLAMADPDNPNQMLGSLIGGTAVSAANHSAGPQLRRRFEMNQLDNDIARGLKLEQEGMGGRGRGPLGQMSTRVVGEGEYEGIDAGTEIRVRVGRNGEVIDIVGPNQKPVVSDLPKKATAGAPHYEKDSEGYLITVQGGVADRVKGRDGQPIRVKATDANGEAIEIETPNGPRKIEGLTPGQILNYYGQVGKQEGKDVASQSKRTAKLNESSSLYKKAENLESEAAKLDANIKQLEDGKATFFKDGNIPLPDDVKTFDEQVKELKSQQQKWRTEANDLRVKGDAARAEGESIPEGSVAPSGGKWSASRWAKANPGKDVEKAKKAAAAAGYSVVE